MRLTYFQKDGKAAWDSRALWNLGTPDPWASSSVNWLNDPRQVMSSF